MILVGHIVFFHERFNTPIVGQRDCLVLLVARDFGVYACVCVR